LSLTYFFKEKKFLEDIQDFKEMQGLYNIFGYYMNDYILFMIIIIIIYLVLLILILLSIFINKNKPEFRLLMIKTSILISFCIVVLILFISIYNNKIQRLGQVRDDLTIKVFSSINYEYIEFLDREMQKQCIECNKKNEDMLKGSFNISTNSSINCPVCASTNLVNVNSIDLLQKYITIELLTDMKKKATNININSISIQTFKNYMKTYEDTNKKSDSYYNLIVKSLITYKILATIKETKYDELRDKLFDKNMFYDRNSIISSINTTNYSLVNMEYNKCIIGNMDGIENKSTYMHHVCIECEEISNDIDDRILILKNTLDNTSFPIQLTASSIILFISFIYYISYLSDVNAIISKKGEQQQTITP
jgi:DNA-directed RNA polymerase subunit RPC12/RpoP